MEKTQPQEINLTRKKTVYDKANSILDMRGIEHKKSLILTKLRRYFDDYKNLPSNDLFRKALFDLFGDSSVEDLNKFSLKDHVIEEMMRLPESQYPRYLRYRYAYEINPIIHKVTKFPPLVQIEPASICNYRCVFCFQTDPKFSNKKNGHMGLMELPLFKELVDQLEGNVKGVTLASRGEPTVNKLLPEMMEYLSGKFLATKINTNASLLNDNMIHSILSNDVQSIVFSIDAADKDLYEKLRVNGKFDKTMKNIKRFVEIKEKEYPHSRLITRISGVKVNDAQNLDEMVGVWSPYADIVAFTNYTPWESSYDNPVNKIELPCEELWRRIFVWWDGKVNPCDYDYKSLLSKWNASNTPISEIWNSDIYNNMRKSHLNEQRKEYEPCIRCKSI